MAINENSRYAVQLNRYFLIPIGVWPLAPDATFIRRLLQKGTVMICYWLICFVLTPFVLHTFLEETNKAKKLKGVASLSFAITSIAKYCSLLSGIGEFGKCFEHVEQDWTFYNDRCAKTELSIMRRNARVGRLLILWCAAFMYGGGIFFRLVMPLTVGHFVSIAFQENMAKLKLENSTHYNENAHAPRILTYPVYETLMDVQRSPYYEIVFTGQFITGYVLYTITVASCSLVAGFVVHICGQLEIVMRLLDDFVRSTDAANGEKMKEIVKNHIRALSFAKRVEKNLNAICLVDFIGSTLNICYVGYFFIVEWVNQNTISIVTYSILMISFSFNIFIFCYIGEILTEQCKRVGEISYAIDWYKLPSKKAVDIIMIIIISNCYPARITAGKIVYLSMSSFSTVMKTAVSYINLLRAVML